MYHGRFKKSHYEAGYQWGDRLYRHNTRLNHVPTFTITPERSSFALRCLPLYEKYYPEILAEIRGIAEGQRMSYEELAVFLLSMYCFELQPHCTCFAFQNEEHIILGRNSDFLVSLEKLYMNCLYQLDHAFAFNGNTTAFVQMEDGVNEYGLAVGLTFIYPTIIQPGFHAGMLVRYLLEKCKTTTEAITALRQLPIASQQTLTIADSSGDIVTVECNCKAVEVILPKQEEGFVAAVNKFYSPGLKSYHCDEIDNWRADERYDVALHALREYRDCYSLSFACDILAGKYGFMCQYDRKQNADTVWSVVYDLKQKAIYRAEGNPMRKQYKRDYRMKWQ